MEISEFVFNTSPIWIIPVIAGALIYAVLLYSKKGPWGNRLGIALAIIRFITVAVIGLLLINPMIRQIQNTQVKPKAVIIVDNSSSLKESLSKEELSGIKTSTSGVKSMLEEKGFDVHLRNLESEITNLDSLSFEHTSTNIMEALKSAEDFYDENELTLSVLVSDGIYNLGASPEFSNYAKPVYTIGVGDTIPKKDITIHNIRYNKVVTQGNKFPIEVDILHNGYPGNSYTINLLNKGAILESKSEILPSGVNLQTIGFEVDTEATGLTRFTIDIPVITGEQVTSNNRKDVYIDIIDNSEKVLILSSAPHPDIKALKSAIEKNPNYEVFLHSPGINDLEDEEFGVVIAHQPFAGNRRMDALIATFQETEIPIWYILGTRTNFNEFNSENELIIINQIRGQFDRVTPAFNELYSKFNLSDEVISRFIDCPPIIVPYGDISLKNPSESLFYQRVGSIESTKPLLIVGETGGKKEATLVGMGFWQWRIQEIAKTDNAETFDTWATKLIQYLNTKENKKKFRVNTSKDEYSDLEAVVFEAEAYNNIYENIYNIPINLSITSEDNETSKYSFITTEANSSYRISGLDPGVYTFQASTTLDGKREIVNSGFSVVQLQIESINLTADFGLLRRLAQNTGGKFSTINDEQTLNTLLEEQTAQGVIYSDEKLIPLIHFKWLLILLIGLASIEWFTRKYMGGY